MIRLLYVEDVSLWQNFVRRVFRDDPESEIIVAESVSHALETLETYRPNVVLLDLGLPRFPDDTESPQHGLELLQKIRLWNPKVPVLIITQHGTEVPLAVEAMKAGAVDYILKRDEPSVFDEIQLKVYQCHRRASEQARLESDNQARAQALQGISRPLPLEQFGPIIGNSPAMRSIYGLVERVASTDATLLLLGERGTGKSLLAKTIHEKSHRARNVFYPVAMPRFDSNELLLDELFGHAKGAFTGATKERPGIFEYADGGTVFLDEIGDIDLGVQAKLLQFIEDKSLKRLGDNRPRQADVRLIAATNQDLEQAVTEGRFRADLYDRLNVISITLPPLRERKEDLFLLIPHFLERFRVKYGKERVVGFAPDALQALQGYDYPGNVRELEHAIDRAVALASGTQVTLTELPEKLRAAPTISASLLNPRQQKLLRQMRSGMLDSITNQSYRELTGVGHNTTHRDLTDLVERGHLVIEGAGRGVHYHLTSPNLV